MSNYPQPGYQQGTPGPAYPPQQSGCGCGGCLGKILIFVGVVFVLLIAVCCGGIYYLMSSFKQQPAEVTAMTEGIISINAAPLEPELGLRLKNPLTGTYYGESAIYADTSHKATMILVSCDPQYTEFFIQFIRSKAAQNQPPSGEENEELKNKKTTELEPAIQGEKAHFEIDEGVGVQSGKKKIRVQGEFKGKSGPAFFTLNAEADLLSLEKVKEMIKSMK
jgi:hypothetical protein